MATAPISILLPIGPETYHSRLLDEALASIKAQDVMPDEVVVIDESGISLKELREKTGVKNINLWVPPWRSGISMSYNFGVGLAKNDLSIFLASDDAMRPDCVDECYKAWLRNEKRDAFYWMPVFYNDGENAGKTQVLPCGACMVTRGFWKWCGGYPPACGVGACDFLLISQFYGTDALYQICAHAIYDINYVGSGTDRQTSWWGAIMEVHKVLDANFKPNGVLNG